MTTSTVMHTTDVERRGQAYSYSRKKVLEKLDTLVQQADARIRELQSANASPDVVYNYALVRNLLTDVREYVEKGVKVDTRSTYIMPGALWIVKSLINNRINLDMAAYEMGAVRYLARKMFRTLVYEKNLTLLIPSNLRASDVKAYLWPDKVGYDSEGNPLYMLTMYFSFPFDISELDKKSEYEPIAVLFVRKGNKFIPLKAYARVHYDIYVYDLEETNDLTVLFMRYGHTPKVLGSGTVRVSGSNIVKEGLDRLWLALGDALTRLSGVNRVRIRDDPTKIHVYVRYKLPSSVNNVFDSAVHPYFVNITI